MLTLSLITAAVAALRGVWSPCGLSMLSSLNPVSESARGHRFGVTACWYVAGAAFGGALLGGCCAAGAIVVRGTGVPSVVVWSLALAAAVVAVMSDLPMLRWTLPIHPRQVDERWLHTYRRWIYASGYGVQIGTGFATYIMSATVYLLAALAVLTGSPAQAFGAGLAFGVLRGLAVMVAATARTPERLRDLLARIDAWDRPSRLLCLAVEVSVAAAVTSVLAGPRPAVAVALAGLALVGAGWVGARGGERRSGASRRSLSASVTRN